MNIYESLNNEITRQWNRKLLGELKGISIKKVCDNSIGSDADRTVEPCVVSLMLSSMSAAVSTINLIGKAAGVETTSLRSVKNRMDISAGYAFDSFSDKNEGSLFVAISEGKDERGNIVDDPLKQTIGTEETSIGVAVDVVDGTTLAAKGLDGAYSISAGAAGLQSFPDLQAYAIGGPVDVLDKIDFFKCPEEEVQHLIHLLSDYYGKEPSQLRIVTHSCDTGTHHSRLVSVMESMGVTVIIPDPVIVEPPYVAAMALHGAESPDAMIGVFGLPEIVINALLCANITDKQELWFRIASNSMLKEPEKTNLDLAFDFSPDEYGALESRKLSTDKIYTKMDLADTLEGSCFTAVALTDDPVLGFHGIKREGVSVYMETLFSGFHGLTLKIKTEHGVFHDISYPARRALRIDDISAVAFVPEGKSRDYLLQVLRKFKNEKFNFVRYSEIDDLHVTVCEYGVHYGGYVGDMSAEIEKHSDFFGEKSFGKQGYEIDRVQILGDSLICGIRSVDESESTNMFVLPENKCSVFDNVNSAPKHLHVTLGRFTEYTSQLEMHRLEAFLDKLQAPDDGEKYFFADVNLIHIQSTPYNDVHILA